MTEGSTVTFKILFTELAVRLNLWTRVTIQLIKSSLAIILHGVICLPIFYSINLAILIFLCSIRLDRGL